MPRCTKVAIFDFTLRKSCHFRFHASQKLPFYEEHIGQALAKLHPHFFCKSYKISILQKVINNFKLQDTTYRQLQDCTPLLFLCY